MDSPFDVLAIDPDADEETVTRAYRERIKEVHPDQGGSAAEFRRVKTAYEAIVEEEAPKAGDLEGSDTDESDAAERDNGGTDNETGGSPSDDEPAGARVEYLNYERMTDFGWELDDDDLFEKAAKADLDASDYGELRADPDEILLEAAEEDGYVWPFSCRGGACANCAVAVVEGDLSMPANHILPPSMTERGIRLSCVGRPTTDELRVVYNIKHLPGLDELRLPPGPFKGVQSDG